VHAVSADIPIEDLWTMEQFSSDDARPARYATRQPILAADETVIGYKLLFRTDVVSHFSAEDANAEARTTIDMAMLLGLDVLCDHRLAFIGCNRDLLLDHGLAFLPGSRAVAEIERAVEVDDVLVNACCDLKNAGYRIALEEFTEDDPRQAIVHLADYLKVDVRQEGWEETRQVVGLDAWKHAVLLATNVETREVFDLARTKGFQLFQGYFFRKPESLRTRSAPTNRAVYFRLLQAVMKPELDWNTVEELIKSDPTLYFRLLRFINSAVFGLRGEVRTIQQAFTLMGDNELRRWCRLAGMFEMAQGRPSELLLSTLVRARLAELLGTQVEHGSADLFLLGLLSMMDSILEIPMSAVIEGLALDEPSTMALLDHKGRLGMICELIEALEIGTWNAAVERCRNLGINEAFAAESFSNAMAWAQSLAASA
jgi:EAL and modified HD-GYP domain-containing signal transduction protein